MCACVCPYERAPRETYILITDGDFAVTASQDSTEMGLQNGFAERELFYRYRKDRAELLTFVLTAGLFEKVVMPPGTIALDEVDLNQVSVDHVLDCARKGIVLELWEAIERFHDDMKLSYTVGSGVRDCYSLAREPAESGLSPALIQPFETLPTVASNDLEELSFLTISAQQLKCDEGDADGEAAVEKPAGMIAVKRLPSDASDLTLDLPPFVTGLSETELRETAYEVLLASVGGAGGLISSAKEKSSKVERLTKSMNIRTSPQPARAPGLAGLLETMRIQMQISEATDIRTREVLLRAAAGRVGKRMDTLLVPLDLLLVATLQDFPDQKSFFSWEKRQLNLLEEGLVNHTSMRPDMSDRLGADLRLLIGKIEQAQILPAPFCQLQRVENLRSLRGIAMALAEGVGSGEQSGDFCHWADGYYLNVRLYEMLLNSVFDRADSVQIVEEVEEILELLKSTWRVLGITQTVHDTCYTWVLFHQFVLKGEAALLQHATQQMKRIACDGQRGAQERSYMKSLRSASNSMDSSQELTYVQSVLIPIKLWADKHLENYHAHFLEDLGNMDALVTIAMIASRLIADEVDQSGSNKLSSTADIVAVAKQAKDYISSSVAQAFEHVLEVVDSKWESQIEHPLALLAEEVLVLSKREVSMFSPILARWHPQAQAISALLLHNLYYTELKPFVEGVTNLTEDVTSVLPAADGLESYLRQLIISVSDEGSNNYKQQMVPYQVEVVASNLIMQWVSSQLASLTECIEKIVTKESWEIISIDQCYATSVIEVFQKLDSIVDQFFCLMLPMRVPVLQNLMNGLDGAIQLYANRIVAQLGSIADLIPSVPGLTRYKKDTVVKAFSKKKLAESKILDENRITEIDCLTTSRLCICLNTLHHLLCKSDALEENIKERWLSKRSNDDQTSLLFSSHGILTSDGDLRSRHLSRSSEEFPIGLETCKKVIKNSIDRFCEFAGTKIIFWDMRESFIDGMYKTCVSQSRMSKIISGLDLVLGQLCEMIVEPLRDQVVMGLFQASLDGLLRVLLDGGSSRSFSQSDGELLIEDLNILKEFFVADGDGLPKALVDNAAAPAQQVIDLYKVETWIVIENFKHANDQSLGSSAPHKVAGRIPSDTDMLLRVLCHRPDREASKFLKKQYKLP